MAENIHFLLSNKAFKHIKRYPRSEQVRILNMIRTKVYGFVYHNDTRFLKQDHYFSKMGTFDSTIYYIRLDLHNRAIISVDEDPIFDETRVNILSICNHDNLQREIKGIMQSLYQKMINDTSYEEEDAE